MGQKTVFIKSFDSSTPNAINWHNFQAINAKHTIYDFMFGHTNYSSSFATNLYSLSERLTTLGTSIEKY